MNGRTEAGGVGGDFPAPMQWLTPAIAPEEKRTFRRGGVAYVIDVDREPSVGVKEFDDDHKRLIRRINEMHGIIRDGNSTGKIEAEEIEIALHRLENYFQYHCLKEEEAMVKVGFSGLEEHRQEHAHFGKG